MRYCDLTFAYTPTSGGIRTFIDQKRQHLVKEPGVEHVLIVPGRTDGQETDGRCTVVTLASPYIPGCEPYRTFVRPRAVLNALRRTKPDIIELGTFFVEPWAAFRYRAEVGKTGGRCVIGGYFHTDLALSYFGAPVRSAMTSWFGPSMGLLAHAGRKMGDGVQSGATRYFGSLFKRCDLMCAASTTQIQRLAEYGIHEAHVVPLGVDLVRFNPSKRSEIRRRELGASGGTTVLVYAGRMDREKQVHVLLDAFEKLRRTDVVLWLLGEGPDRSHLESRARRVPGAHVLPYEANPDRLAELLASADIYVTAGAHETFGLSIVEAQACGLPVCGVSSGALLDRVVPGTGFLSPVGDAAAMALNIERTLPVARGMGAAARAAVIRAGLDWEGTFTRWQAVYGEAWNPRGAGHPPIARDPLVQRA